MLEVDVDVRELASDHHLQVADDAVDIGLGGGAAPVGGLGRKLDGDDVAHVLLWFAVFVAFDVIKMGDAMPSVYRENRFSVDLKENPMFAGVKQESNPSQVDVAQAHECLSVDRCVEITDDPLSLSLRIAVVVFHAGRNHRRKLSRLAVFRIPVS